MSVPHERIEIPMIPSSDDDDDLMVPGAVSATPVVVTPRPPEQVMASAGAISSPLNTGFGSMFGDDPEDEGIPEEDMLPSPDEADTLGKTEDEASAEEEGIEGSFGHDDPDQVASGDAFGFPPVAADAGGGQDGLPVAIEDQGGEPHSLDEANFEEADPGANDVSPAPAPIVPSEPQPIPAPTSPLLTALLPEVASVGDVAAYGPALMMRIQNVPEPAPDLMRLSSGLIGLVCFDFGATRIYTIEEGKLVQSWEFSAGWDALAEVFRLEMPNGTRVAIDTEAKLRRAVTGEIRVYGQTFDTRDQVLHLGDFVAAHLRKCLSLSLRDGSDCDRVILVVPSWLSGVMPPAASILPHLQIKEV